MMTNLPKSLVQKEQVYYHPSFYHYHGWSDFVASARQYKAPRDSFHWKTAVSLACDEMGFDCEQPLRANWWYIEGLKDAAASPVLESIYHHVQESYRSERKCEQCQVASENSEAGNLFRSGFFYHGDTCSKPCFAMIQRSHVRINKQYRAIQYIERRPKQLPFYQDEIEEFLATEFPVMHPAFYYQYKLVKIPKIKLK